MQRKDDGSGMSGRARPDDRTGGLAAVRRLTSAELLAGAREVLIEHESELYRLRCTSKGKLILTK